VGPNNSGKTSALDVVALFVQTARAGGGKSGLVWSGDLVDLGVSGEHAVHNGVPRGVLSIAVEIQTPRSFIEFIHGRLPEAQLPARTIGYRVSFQRIPNRYQYEFIVDGELVVRNFLRELAAGGNRAELDIPSLSSQANRVEFVPATYTQTDVFNSNLFDAGVHLPADVMSKLSIANKGIQVFRDVLSTQVFLLGASRRVQSEISPTQ
jgi:hypothetical protein